MIPRKGYKKQSKDMELVKDGDGQKKKVSGKFVIQQTQSLTKPENSQ